MNLEVFSHCQFFARVWERLLLIFLWSEVKVAQSCPTLCDPMNYTVHGILQARILEWVAFSRGSSQPRSPALQADSSPAKLQGILVKIHQRTHPFLVGRILINSISLLIIDLFKVSISLWFSLDKLYVSRNLSISSVLSNLFNYSQSCLMIYVFLVISVLISLLSLLILSMSPLFSLGYQAKGL